MTNFISILSPEICFWRLQNSVMLEWPVLIATVLADVTSWSELPSWYSSILHPPPLCPPTGGLPEQHRPHSGGKLHLQPQHHHRGHRHIQQFGQLHLGQRGWRLAAPRHLLLPHPHLNGSLCPAALLLKPPAPSPQSRPSPPLLFLSSASAVPSRLPPYPLCYPTQFSLTLLSLYHSWHRDHKTKRKRMDSTQFFFVLLMVKKPQNVIRDISCNK